MKRIGLAWSDNSHAEIFSRLLNLSDPSTGAFLADDCRITAVWGADAAATRSLAAACAIPEVVARAEDLLGRVDAVMVIFRNGAGHRAVAEPFLREGVPTWIDKPIALDRANARAIITAARKGGAPLTGGSTLRWSPDVQLLARAARGDGGIGTVRAGSLSFPATRHNDWGGFPFYATHLAEMCLRVFGPDPKSVWASDRSGWVTAVVSYADRLATLHFTSGLDEHHGLLYGERGVLSRPIDIATVFREGLLAFLDMVRSGRPPFPPEELGGAVSLVEAVEQSLAGGREVDVELLET